MISKVSTEVKRKVSKDSKGRKPKIYSDSSLQISVDVYKSIALDRPTFLRNELLPGTLRNLTNKSLLWKECVKKERNLLRTKNITKITDIKDVFDRCIQQKNDIAEVDLDYLIKFADYSPKFAGEYVMASLTNRFQISNSAVIIISGMMLIHFRTRQ